jgi:3-keto-disaccharide hydrolase
VTKPLTLVRIVLLWAGWTLLALGTPQTLPTSSAAWLDDGESDDGFTPLFDGKSLAGWEGDEKLWKVESGMLVGDSPGIKRNEFLATKKRYANFELRLDFRLRDGSGNSGIQFRSKRVPASSEVSGYQADIGEKYWGCLYDESRRNKILVQAPPELDDVLRKDGWNSYVIRAEGDHITLSLNGRQTVDYREPDPEIARDGVIALQVHAGDPLRVEFKNLRIRELADK